MNWIQSLRHDRWMHRLYILVITSPILILIYGFVQQLEAYQRIRRGIQTLQTSEQDGLFSGVHALQMMDPSLQRLELVSVAHVVMMILEGMCLLFVVGWVLKVIFQRHTFYTPRTTLLQVWSISVIPTITVYLFTEAIINQTNDGSSGWLVTGIIAALWGSIWLYTKLKQQDELEQTELASPHMGEKAQS